MLWASRRCAQSRAYGCEALLGLVSTRLYTTIARRERRARATAVDKDQSRRHAARATRSLPHRRVRSAEKASNSEELTCTASITPASGRAHAAADWARPASGGACASAILIHTAVVKYSVSHGTSARQAGHSRT